MGTYSTTTALQTLMIGTTFDTATTALATKCITDAENEIKKKFARRFDMAGTHFAPTTTASSVPPLVTSICELYSEGLMRLRMSRGDKDLLAHGNNLIKLASDNINLVMAGTVDLVDTAGSLIAERSGRTSVICNTSDYHSTFNEDDDIDWSVDPDKLDDIADERS